MALGFVNFSAGQVFTEAQVDGIMRQTTMVFASASARDTALSGVLDEGMTVYLEDTNSYYFYTGSAWKPLLTQWTAFTPTWTNLTVGNGTNVGRYRYVGDQLQVKVRFTFGSTSAVTGGSSFALPNSETAANDGTRNIGHAWFLDATSTDAVGWASVNGNSSNVFMYVSTVTVLSSTVPFTWATSDIIEAQIDVTV